MGTIRGTRLARVCLCIAILAVLPSLACGPLAPKTSTPPAAAPSATSAPAQPPAPEAPTPTPTPAPQGQEGKGKSDPGQAEGLDLLDCPPAGHSMLLKFSANIAMDYGPAHIEHALQDGVLNLTVVQGDGGAARIEGVEAAPIPYTMSGTMEKCELSGQGMMTPSAQGYCENGVVFLTITENWGPYEGQMTCENKTVPYNIPAMGTMTHSGADGRGEAFPLDKGFSNEGAGYTSIRTSQGANTSGDHIWTLFYDYTGPVR